MKSLLFAFAALFFTQGASHAVTNLITNGDFASGQLTPWTATGSATITNGVCALDNASIKQTIATVVGTRYYLSASINVGFGAGANVTISATPATGGPADGTRTISYVYGKSAIIFTASSASTVITLAGAPPPGGFGGAPSVDDIRLAVLPPSRFAGRYIGTFTTTLASTDPALRQATAKRVVARIGQDGRIVIFVDATTIQVGRIFNDRSFDLSIIPSFNVTFSGIATATPNHLDLRGATSDSSAVDDLGVIVTGKTSVRYLLTRTGP
jgi:hypothetical protein